MADSVYPAPRLCGIYLGDVFSLLARDALDKCRAVSAHCTETFCDREPRLANETPPDSKPRIRLGELIRTHSFTLRHVAARL